MKPGELVEAEMIVALCQRFHCLPSALLSEPALLLRYVALADMGSAMSDA